MVCAGRPQQTGWSESLPYQRPGHLLAHLYPVPSWNLPNYFPNAQFPRGSEALNQWWRQQTPDTAPTTDAVATAAVATMFDQIGPAVLITHSASGVYGWETATQSKMYRHLRLCARHAGVPIGCGSRSSSSGSLGPDHRDAYLASRFPEAHKNPDRDYLGRQFPDRRTAALALSRHRDLARAHHHGAEVRRSNQRARRPPLSDASSRHRHPRQQPLCVCLDLQTDPSLSQPFSRCRFRHNL